MIDREPMRDARAAVVTGEIESLEPKLPHQLDLIGREHALALAREGARVVVNDLGCDRHGGGSGAEMADRVVEAIRAAGGEAVASYDSVATREGADGILWTAQSRFGRVDVLVNNAGILRDRTLLNMSEEDFDRVLEVQEGMKEFQREYRDAQLSKDEKRIKKLESKRDKMMK